MKKLNLLHCILLYLSIFLIASCTDSGGGGGGLPSSSSKNGRIAIPLPASGRATAPADVNKYSVTVKGDVEKNVEGNAGSTVVVDELPFGDYEVMVNALSPDGIEGFNEPVKVTLTSDKANADVNVQMIQCYPTTEKLVEAISSKGSGSYWLSGDINLSEKLIISSGEITLNALSDKTVTFRRTSEIGCLSFESKSLNFDTNVVLGSEGGKIVIDGANLKAEQPLVTVSSSELTLGKNSVVQNHYFESPNMDGKPVSVSAILVTQTSGSNYSGKLILDGGKIMNNTNNGQGYVMGGGVYVEAGSFEMNDGEISGNTVSVILEDSHNTPFGGGVCISGYGTSFVMNGGKITGNTADSTSESYPAAGGGVFVGDIISGAVDNCIFTKSAGAIIENNKAVQVNKGNQICVMAGTYNGIKYMSELYTED